MSKKKLFHIFVYGTLREGQAATHYLTWHKLWTLGRFPCITPTGKVSDVVYGNIISVNKAMLEKLDRYERLDIGLYTREKVRVCNLDGTFVDDKEVEVYMAGNCFPQPIESGDWLIHLQNQ